MLLILFQFLANIVIPDHDAGVFNPPVTGLESFTLVDKIIFFVFGGFRRWDAIYFLHISQHGYTYENCVAFFPLYPLIMSTVKGVSDLCPFLSESSLLLLFGVLINVALFAVAAVLLLRLGQVVTQDHQLAYNAAVLFCVNPASIFMTAPYTETLFACLSFGGMLCVKQQRLFAGAALFGASALTRSNGLVSTGFILHHFAVEYTTRLAAVYRTNYNRELRFVTRVIHETMSHSLRAMGFFLISLIPFACYQLYIYELFCFPESQAELKSSMESAVINYGHREEYKVVGEGPVSPWCFATLPLSYSYIQSHHWGVGFLAYYRAKQIPNFILAAPIITLSLYACYSFYCAQPTACQVLGLIKMEKSKVETIGGHSEKEKSGWKNAELVVYVLHLLFLTSFGCFFMHIQVCFLIVLLLLFVLFFAPHVESQENLCNDEYLWDCNKFLFLVNS